MAFVGCVVLRQEKKESGITRIEQKGGECLEKGTGVVAKQCSHEKSVFDKYHLVTNHPLVNADACRIRPLKMKRIAVDSASCQLGISHTRNESSAAAFSGSLSGQTDGRVP